MADSAKECSTAEICAAREADPLYSAYQVDKDYKYYIDNWYLEMDLLCTSTASIGFLVTAFYIGFVIGGLFSTMPDKYGRKWSLMFGLMLSCISQSGMLISSNYWVRYAMFFLAGLS